MGGERALTRNLWNILPARYKDRSRIEAGLNLYAVYHGSGLKFRMFRGISQTVKEAKFGYREGIRRRLAMFWEVSAAAWDLQWNDLPRSDRAHRAAAGMTALTTAGMLFGLLLVAAGFAGPVSFFNSLFAEELAEDPSAPLARTVLATVSGAGATTAIGVGVTVLVGNALFFFRSLARLVTFGRVRESA